MNKTAKRDLRKVDGKRCRFLLTIAWSIVYYAYLPAQQNRMMPDSSRLQLGGLSSYLTSKKISWYWQTAAFDLHPLEIKYPVNSYQTYLNRSLADYDLNPFKIDFRGSSYYVPAMVRDELNLIMNRPKDSAFLPVLGIAWIAYQMASRYLEVQRKNIVGYHELLKARTALPVLYCLWQEFPQSARQLYRHQVIQDSMIYKQVLENLELLQQNNLIKTRIISLDSILYFPNLNRDQMLSILELASRNPDVPQSEKIILQILHKSVWVSE